MKPMPPPTSPDLDETRLREMLDLVGPASEARLLRSLVKDLGAARLALSQALAAGDVPAICAQTHVLAALASTFGAPQLAGAAQDLERQVKAARPAPADGIGVLSMTERLARRLSQRIGGLAKG